MYALFSFFSFTAPPVLCMRSLLNTAFDERYRHWIRADWTRGCVLEFPHARMQGIMCGGRTAWNNFRPATGSRRIYGGEIDRTCGRAGPSSGRDCETITDIAWRPRVYKRRSPISLLVLIFYVSSLFHNVCVLTILSLSRIRCRVSR